MLFNRWVNSSIYLSGEFLQSDWSGGIGTGAKQFESSQNIITTAAGHLQLAEGAITGVLTSRIFDAGKPAGFGRVEITGTQGLVSIPGTHNLLPNASFEWGPQGSLEYWEATGSENGFITHTLVSDLPFQASAGHWAYLGQNSIQPSIAPVEVGLRTSIPIAVNPFLTYALSVDFRTPDGPSGTLTGSVIAYDKLGQEIGKIVAFTQTTTSTEWQRYTGTISFSSIPSEVATVRPQFIFNAPIIMRFMLDAIQFEPGIATPFHEGYDRSTFALYVRTGPTPTPDTSWTRWQEVSTYVPTELGQKRYLQYQIKMTRTNTEAPSPLVTRVRIKYITPSVLDWPVIGRDLQKTSFQPGSSDITKPMVRWRVSTGGRLRSSEMTDLDADGFPEFIFSEAGRIRAVSIKDGRDLWVSPYLQPEVSLVRVIDVNGDNRKEILVTATPRFTFIVLDGLTGQTLCHFENGWLHGYDAVWNTFKDVSGDGITDWVSTAFNGTNWVTYMWSFAKGFGEGGICHPVWQTPHPGWNHHATEAGDLDGDGHNEVVVFDPPIVKVLDGSTGKILAEYSQPGIYGELTELVLQDMDNDGSLEIIAHSWSGRVINGGNLSVLKYTKNQLTPLWTISNDTTWYYENTQKIVDASHDWNGDGFPDVVFNVSLRDMVQHVYIYDGQNGHLIKDLIRCWAVAGADFDGDGQIELLTVLNKPVRALQLLKSTNSKWEKRWSLEGTLLGILRLEEGTIPLIGLYHQGKLWIYQDKNNETPRLVKTLPVDVPISGLYITETNSGIFLGVSYQNGKVTFWNWETGLQQSEFQVGNWAAPVWAIPERQARATRLIFWSSTDQTAQVKFPSHTWRETVDPTSVSNNLLYPLYLTDNLNLQYFTQLGPQEKLIRSDTAQVWETPIHLKVLGYGNFNGKGRLDIFGLSPLGYIALDGDNGKILWTRAFSAYFPNVLAINDLNNDGYDDIIGIWGYAMSGIDGTLFRHYPSHEDARFFTVNLNEDPEPEIISAAGGYQVGVFAQDGRLLWSLPLADDGYETTDILPTFLDADGDQIMDIAIPNASGRLRILRGKDGKVLQDLFLSQGKIVSPETQKPSALSNAVSTDINGDGQVEVLVGSGDGWLYAIRARDGQIVWTYNFVYPIQDLILADVDGDAQVEVIVSVSDGYLYVVDQTP
ncbi:MAG TPA: FG-GAP-like repeat-containing protein [Candidatus Limnocylindrales bacterium]|nr:FG-GAP-like repeat-containing protein [Candidatus Limnocylindrales bacterium]